MLSKFLNKIIGGSKEPLALEGKDIQLVDVRTHKEFSSGSVPKAINIPLSTVKDSLNQFSHEQTIVVFCRSGARSGRAKSILEKNGFSDVINGGSWQAVNKSLNTL